MSGPVPAPATPPVGARVPAAGAGQLALYAAEGQQVLAPRGWHCLEIHGSGGAFLLVTPDPYTAATLPDTNRLVSLAVELSLLNGENSGRNQVAEVFSRLFPFKRAFIVVLLNIRLPPRLRALYPVILHAAAAAQLGGRELPR